MGLFKSKEDRILGKKLKEEERILDEKQKEEEESKKKSDGMQEFRPFLDLLNKSAEGFVNTLKERGVYPTWEFEVQPHIDWKSPLGSTFNTKDVMVIDASEMTGIAFDDVSEKCVYYTCTESKYDNKNPKTGGYEYTILCYKDILSAKVEVDDVVYLQSKSVSSNVIGGAVLGGIIGGGIGALIGATTMPQSTSTETETETKKIALYLQTANPQYRTIQFEFEKYNLLDENNSTSDNIMSPAECSTFFKQPYRTEDALIPCSRKCGTTMDCRFQRNGKATAYGSVVIPYDAYRPQHFDDIKIELIKYTRKIESVIISNSKQENQIHPPQPDTSDRLKKLKSLYEEDLITAEEYKSRRETILSET